MKKLLLSSTVMLFLCSVSFAQAKNTVLSKEAKEAKQKEQDELDKNTTTSITPSLPHQETYSKSSLQKQKLQKSGNKSQLFIIEPEQEAPKASTPSNKRKTSN